MVGSSSAVAFDAGEESCSFESGARESGVALLVLNFQKKKREKEMAAMVDFHRKSFTESGGTDPKMNEKIKSQRRSREAV